MAFPRFQSCAESRRDSRGGTGWLREIGLARERLGEEGNSAGLSNGRHRRICPLTRRSSRSSTNPLFLFTRSRRRMAFESFLVGPAFAMVPTLAAGDLHATDVCECGCLRGRWHDDRFARSGGELRAGRPQLSHFSWRTDWRRARTCGALPVIIEDEVLVGGNSGVYEGTVVKRRAVLGTGTILIARFRFTI